MLPTQFAAPFDAFIGPARIRPHLWRAIVGMVIIFVGFVAAFLIMGAILSLTAPTDQMLEAHLSGQTAIGIIVIFLSTGGASLGVWLSVRLLHKRNFATLIGPWNSAKRDFAIAASVMLAVHFTSLIIWSFFYDADPKTAGLVALSYLPIMIAIVLIQTSAEEFVFRGYLMQQLAARFQSPLIWVLVPQIVFAALHWSPETMGDNIWLIMASVFLFGLFAADLVRITGNLGAACGWHFANNLFLLTVIGNKGDIDAVVLFTTPYAVVDMPTALVIADIVVVIVTWTILRRILRP